MTLLGTRWVLEVSPTLRRGCRRRGRPPCLRAHFCPIFDVSRYLVCTAHLDHSRGWANQQCHTPFGPGSTGQCGPPPNSLTQEAATEVVSQRIASTYCTGPFLPSRVLPPACDNFPGSPSTATLTSHHGHRRGARVPQPIRIRGSGPVDRQPPRTWQPSPPAAPPTPPSRSGTLLGTWRWAAADLAWDPPGGGLNVSLAGRTASDPPLTAVRSPVSPASLLSCLSLSRAY